jgi:hypothetical protein
MSIFIFGYGALINPREIKQIYPNKKIYPAKVEGLKRVFNVETKDGRYKMLGVKKSHRHWCNGVLFTVNENELAKLIQREKHYTPELLNKDQIIYKQSLPDFQPQDQIIYFLSKPPYRLTQKQADALPIKPGYLNKCLSGAAAISEPFLQDFVETTENIKI